MLKAKIVKTKDVCGGSPRIDGRRIRVMDIVETYEFLGYSPEKIAEEFELSLAEVFAALQYYYEHPQEIRDEIREHKEFVEKLKHGERA